MTDSTNIDLNEEVPVSDLVLPPEKRTPEAQEQYAKVMGLRPRTGTPVTDAFREWQKNATPEQLQEFADAGNALAAGLRAAPTASAVVEDVPSPYLSFDDFKKVEIRVGTILTAERVPKADKLVKLSVDLGEPTPRQIIAGIGLTFQTFEGLVGKQFAFVANLAPKKVFKHDSQGMILATGEPDRLSLVQLSGPVPNGSLLG